MPMLHGKAKGSQLQEKLHISKVLSHISTGLLKHFIVVFSMPVHIISQAPQNFWSRLSTDLLYKNVIKEFAENENFIIYPMPSLVAIAALHHYYRLKVQLKRN